MSLAVREFELINFKLFAQPVQTYAKRQSISETNMIAPNMDILLTSKYFAQNTICIGKEVVSSKHKKNR